jgi:hypothetical protein
VPAGRSTRPGASEFVAESLEGSPARIELSVCVLVRLEVQVLPADRTEPGAVGLAENLLGQLERDRVSCPGAEIEVVVDYVVGSPLVSGPGLGIVELTYGEAKLDFRVSETAHARSGERHDEREPEDRPPRDLGGLELDGNGMRHWLVALATEHERIEIDVEAVPPHLARPESQSSEIEGGHVRSVTRTHGLGTGFGAISWGVASVRFDHGS